MTRCERLEICPAFSRMSDSPDKRMRAYCHGDYRKCARHIALQSLGPAEIPRDLSPDDHRRLRQLMAQA